MTAKGKTGSRYPKQNRIIELTCVICGDKFTTSATHKDAKACGYKCRYALRRRDGRIRAVSVPKECAVCGKQFMSKTCMAQQGTCSKSCGYSLRKRKGHLGGPQYYSSGEAIERDGYWLVKTGPGEWITEHRAVIERHLGRKLVKGEIVHHKDGDRKNNSLDNLIVMDKVSHCRLHYEAERIGLKVQAGALEVVDPNAWTPSIEGVAC